MRFLIALFFFNSVWCGAQNTYPADEFESENFDSRYLEYLIKKKVDSLFASKHYKPLVSDSGLYIVAKDHANYLKDRNIVSDTQIDSEQPSFGSQLKFGRNASENSNEYIIRLEFGKSYATLAQNIYKRISELIKDQIIGRQKFQTTGVALSVSSDGKNLTIVHILTGQLGKFVFRENQNFFPYDEGKKIEHAVRQNDVLINYHEDLPYKLVKYDWSNKIGGYKYQQTSKKKLQLGLKTDGNNLIAYSRTPNDLQKVIQGNKDGLVVEVVKHRDYDCDRSEYYSDLSRRNMSSSLNGNLLEPVMKKDLYKYFKSEKAKFRRAKRYEIKSTRVSYRSKAKKSKRPKPILRAKKRKLKRLKKRKYEPNYWESTVGHLSQIPTDEPVETNIIQIKDRRLTVVHQFSGSGEKQNFSRLTDFSFEPVFPKDEMRLPRFRQVFKGLVAFEYSDTIPDLTVLKQLRDTLEGWHLDTIKILANASIEGNIETNKDLYQKRGENIKREFKDLIDADTYSRIYTRENWPLYDVQLKKTPFYRKWRLLPKRVIKKYLKNPKTLEYWKPYLEEQRKSLVLAISSKAVEDTLSFYREAVSHRHLDSLLWKQKYLFDQYKKGMVNIDELINLRISPTREYTRAIANTAIFKIFKNKNDVISNYKFLEKLLNWDPKSSLLLYYKLNYLMSNWKILGGKMQVEERLSEFYELSKSSQFRSEAEELNIAFLLFNLKRIDSEKKYDLLGSSLKKVYEYYNKQDSVVFDSLSCKALASTFLQYDASNYAIKLLEKHFSKKPKEGAIYHLYLKIAHLSPNYKNRDEYIDLLISEKKRLSSLDWCKLFIGPGNINIQIFDNDRIRQEYCSLCNESKVTSIE